MKFIVVSAFLLVLAVSSLAAPSGNGQPGCATSQEIETVLYRNLWDPTAYWKCTELKVPASAGRCPDEEAFQDSVKKCVPWDQWTWEPLKAPPSVPKA
ncbi:uncharacterized protein LOC129914295 [Episyrphus balteatus]|uniref:uncharacterized protein LOC129914295 n=1 Tax=Episyrphus balteatus TaxID=286459 RepID=UPI00248567CE|nr:uncharacterized protein LOC129914295 [Episyrphus balteatus]